MVSTKTNNIPKKCAITGEDIFLLEEVATGTRGLGSIGSFKKKGRQRCSEDGTCELDCKWALGDASEKDQMVKKINTKKQ